MKATLEQLIKKLDEVKVNWETYDEDIVISFEDGNGRPGTINATYYEGDCFALSTSKAKDGYADRNEKEVKTVKAVMTYVKKFAN